MANLPEIINFDPGVYQIETSDPVLGGPSGVTNTPLKNLTNRTAWLKQQVDNLNSGITVPPGIATQAYVADELAKRDMKRSVRAATVANITLSGTQTIDGVSLNTGDRILVKNQTTGSQNGIYVVSASAWTRADDANADAEVTPGLLVYIEEGTLQAKSIWKMTNTGTVTVGTTALVFEDITAGFVTANGTVALTNKTFDLGFNTFQGLLSQFNAACLDADFAPINSPAFTGNPTVPTPAQFDNDSSIANTEFVRRAQGSHSDVVVVTTNRTMTAADAGRYLFANANNLTFTLPDPASIPLGTVFRIAQGNLTSGGTIQTPGSVTIGNITDGGTVSSIAISQSADYLFTVVSATSYQVTINRSPLGVGQTWQNLTLSRSIGVNYTNTTSKPIVVNVSGITPTNAAGLSLNVGGIVVSRIYGALGTTNPIGGVLIGIVLPGQVYSVTQFANGGASVDVWAELR